jgi:hypothetical protein
LKDEEGAMTKLVFTLTDRRTGQSLTSVIWPSLFVSPIQWLIAVAIVSLSVAWIGLEPFTAAAAPTPANPLWFQHNGGVYQVGIHFNNDRNVLEYLILDRSGNYTSLPDTDQQGLAWAYEMAQSVYLQPQKFSDLHALHQSMQTVEHTHYSISALAKLQDKLVQAGAAGTAAFFGDAPTAFKVLSDAAIGELTDAILNSPKIAAREWGRAMMDSGLDRLENVILFVENRGPARVGESPESALAVDEVQARYKDAVMVDIFLIPGAELAISLQRKGGLKDQVSDLSQVLLGAVTDAARGAEAVKALLAAREFSKALAESVPAFKECMTKVQARQSHWTSSAAGDGQTPPAGFRTVSGLPSDVLAQPTTQNITTDQARMLLPYTELSLAVYGKDPMPAGWTEISPQRSHVTKLKDFAEGFHAAVYQGPGGQVVVAYEGTNPLSPVDWANNIGHTIVIPKQYKMALKFAEEVIRRNNAGDIILTGHSLGGGLAQYAGGMLGLKTITFNHAGLWAPTYFKVKRRGQADLAQFTHVVTQGFVFKKDLFVKSKQDPVSKWGGYLGAIVRVPMQSPGWTKGFFYRHGMKNLRDAIKAIADVPSKRAADQTIIAIVDSSGSMKNTDPMDLRKAALSMMIDTMDETAALGLIDFDSNTRKLAEPVAIGEFNSTTRHQLKRMVAGIDSDGGTNIGAGLALAADMVPRDGSQVTMVLLTDGKDSKWKGGEDAIPTGIAVHTIALSDQADRDGLGKLSAATGGVAEIARQADDLKRIIGNLFSEATGQEVLLVKTGTINQGDDIFYEVYVDSGQPYVTFQADWRGSDIDLVLIDPAGRRYDTASAVSSGYGIEASNYDIIRVNNPQAGPWQAHLLGVQLPAGGEPYTFKVSANHSAVKTRWKMSMPVAEVGTPMAVDLATRGDVQWQQAHIETWLPDGSRKEKTRTMGGLAAALGGESGISVLNFVPSQTGIHQVRITVQGQRPDGERVQRSFDRTIRVAAPGKGRRYKRRIDPFIRRAPGMLR